MTIQDDALEFIVLYDAIQASTDGDPKRIPFLHKTKPDFAEKCVRISRIHWDIDSTTKDSGDTILENVDSRFTSRWRHYQKEFDPYIGLLWLRQTFEKLGLTGGPKQKLTKRELEEDFKYEVQQEVEALKLRIEVGSLERLKTKRDEVRDKVADGEAVLHRLFRSLNFDFFGCIYRQKQLKVIHVPQHISGAIDDTLLTITNVLKEAHRAFILGLPLATIALCRTASEMVLRDYYKIGDPTSQELLDRFRKAQRHPVARRKGADEELLALVIYGSEMLHGRPMGSKMGKHLQIDPLAPTTDTINRVAFRWLEKLVRLIEGTPKN
jgi:hypothetical protein